MTMMRVPEALGGGEYDGSLTTFAGRRYWAFGTPETGRFYVEEDVLTEVKPPLPEEPPLNSFVHLASYYGVYERVERGWLATSEAGGKAYDWETLVRLNSGDAPVRLIPAPEPVDLPWVREFEDAPAIIVSRSSASNRAAYVENWGHLTADDARQMARALWTVANEHELEATS